MPETITLGWLLGHALMWFFLAVAFGLFLDWTLKRGKRAKKSKPGQTVAIRQSAPQAPAERVYSAAEVRVMATEYHERMKAQDEWARPRRTVRFEDTIRIDPETGEVFE